MPFDPRDCNFEDGDTSPTWLARFVRDEVRPLLVQHRQTALEACTRWLDCHQERMGQLEAWNARRQDFLNELADLPADQKHEAIPPAEGFVWIVGRAVLAEGRTKLVCGWGPPELSGEASLSPEYPLPPPVNRDTRRQAELGVHSGTFPVCLHQTPGRTPARRTPGPARSPRRPTAAAQDPQRLPGPAVHPARTTMPTELTLDVDATDDPGRVT